ncbi:MAG TPA: SpoIIE family protein phosphatase [Nocardioides sp.]|nr:SpoIIE family protein phosphatase [Nocardioides sp.]
MARERYSASVVVRVAAALVAALSLVVGGLLVLTVVQVTRNQSRLENHLNPARVELGAVLALYVGQETGERGYILTGDRDFLDPYDAAAPRIERNLALLREQLSPAARAEVDVMTAAHAAWLEVAERELAAVRAGDRGEAIELVASGEGKRLFDGVRTAERAADEAIAAEQLDATQRADGLLRRLSILLAVTVALFLGAALLAAYGFRRTVLRPLTALGSASRAVAHGRLDQAVTVRGPREVESVAEDVDTMRRHLLDELDASRRAAEALALGEPAVAALEAALALPPFSGPGLSVTGEIASAEGVLAGDFLDVVELDDRQVAVVLGDVSGHGPAAALVGLRLKIAIAGALPRDGLAAALPVVRTTLADDTETFVTLLVAVVDVGADTLSYVNAGHPPPLVVRAEGVDPLEPTGPLVSPVLGDATWDVATVPFGPGERLVAFSDGVLEARDSRGREFGAEGVRAAMRSDAPAHVVRELRSAVRDHEVAPRDDVTILVAGR